MTLRLYVALSKISADFGATAADLQWVIDAYTVGFAVLLQKQIRLSDVELDPGLHLQNQQLLLPRNSPAPLQKLLRVVVHSFPRG